MNIDPKVGGDNWKLPSGKPTGAAGIIAAGGGKISDGIGKPGQSGCPAPQPPQIDDIFPGINPGRPAKPVLPCIGIEVRPDAKSQIEHIRTSKGADQAIALMEFPENLQAMSDIELARAEAYLKEQIGKPYNTDDDLLKALLKAVDQEQNSPARHHLRPRPFPEPIKPWLDGPGPRVVD